MVADLAGVILAAGLGTRLRPLTYFRAKPAVPFLGSPLIHCSLELLARAGVEDCVINLHHLPDSVRRSITDRKVSPRIRFSYEPTILGTAGALARVRDHLGDRTVILANGKIHFEDDLSPVVRWHRDRGAWVTLVLVPYRPGMPFNPVWLDREGAIRSFESSRPESGEPVAPEPGLEPYVFTGIHVLDSRAVSLIPDRPYETVRDLYPLLISSGRPVLGYVSSGYWCETSTPSRYLRKSVEVLERRGIPWLDRSETGAAIDRGIVGRGVTLGRGCSASRSVIWDRVSLAEDTKIVDSIIVEGAEIAQPTEIRNCIVTPRRPRLEPLCRDAGGSVHADHLRWPLPSDPFVRLQSERT